MNVEFSNIENKQLYRSIHIIMFAFDMDEDIDLLDPV